MADESQTTPNSHLLRLENVTKTFQMGEVSVDALCNVSLNIRRGEFIVMVGPSGSGKTTILNLIGGLDRVTSGRMWYGDREITRFTTADLTRYRRETVGFVFQFYNLVPNLTAAENVMVATELSRDPMLVDEALRLVDLQARTGHFPSQLSGGEQQRVAIARAVAKNPALLLVRRADRGAGFRHRQARAADTRRPQPQVGEDGRADHAQRGDRAHRRPRRPAPQRPDRRNAPQPAARAAGGGGVVTTLNRKLLREDPRPSRHAAGRDGHHRRGRGVPGGAGLVVPESLGGQDAVLRPVPHGRLLHRTRRRSRWRRWRSWPRCPKWPKSARGIQQVVTVDLDGVTEPLNGQVLSLARPAASR